MDDGTGKGNHTDDRQIAHLICVRLKLSGTAKGGRPWRGSVKIEPGFFPGFLI